MSKIEAQKSPVEFSFTSKIEANTNDNLGKARNLRRAPKFLLQDGAKPFRKLGEKVSSELSVLDYLVFGRRTKSRAVTIDFRSGHQFTALESPDITDVNYKKGIGGLDQDSEVIKLKQEFNLKDKPEPGSLYMSVGRNSLACYGVMDYSDASEKPRGDEIFFSLSGLPRRLLKKVAKSIQTDPARTIDAIAYYNFELDGFMSWFFEDRLPEHRLPEQSSLLVPQKRPYGEQVTTEDGYKPLNPFLYGKLTDVKVSYGKDFHALNSFDEQKFASSESHSAGEVSTAIKAAQEWKELEKKRLSKKVYAWLLGGVVGGLSAITLGIFLATTPLSVPLIALGSISAVIGLKNAIYNAGKSGGLRRYFDPVAYPVNLASQDSKNT